MPAGVIKVFRGFDNMFPYMSTIPNIEILVPIPTLLALPSIPIIYLLFSYYLDISNNL